MKVVILNNDFRVYWKGRLIFLRKYLGERNIAFNAVELFGKGSPYAFDTVNSNEAWWTCLFPYKSASELDKKEIKAAIFKALDDIGADVVIGPSIVFYAGALGIAWAKKRGKRFVMFDDARPAQVKRNFIVQGVKDLITAQCDALWLPSAGYDNDYAYFKQKGVHFFYGFSCIDNSLFKTASRTQTGTKVIICVARLVPIKNFNGLLTAWQQVEKQNTGYRLNILGDGPEKEDLLEQAAQLKLQTVTFTPAVGNNELPAHFTAAEAFVLASFSETWGLVVNEAMAAGLPVLLSNTINAAADLLKQGENGFSFTATNVDDIAATLLKYIRLDDASKVRMSDASLQIIDKMSYDRMGEQLTEALKVVTSKKKRTSLLAGIIISKWHGRYNTSGWDKL